MPWSVGDILARIVEIIGPGDGLFVYNGNPGLNNLLASITNTSPDPFGNLTHPVIAVYGIGDPGSAVNMTTDSNGNPWILFRTGSAIENKLANVQALINSKGTPGENIIFNMVGPTITGKTAFPFISLTTDANDGSVIATGVLGHTGASPGTIAYWRPDGTHFLFPIWGTGGVLTIGDQISRTTTGVSGYPVITETGNPDNIVTGTSPAKLSSVWTIPANDAQAGTAYRIKGYGYGLHEGNVFSIQVTAWGTVLALVPIGGAWTTTGNPFDFDFEAIVRVQVAGSSAKVSGSVAGNISVDNANLIGDSSTQASFGFNRNAENVLSTVNTTVSSNITVQAFFAATNASQFAECTFDTFERLGP